MYNKEIKEKYLETKSGVVRNNIKNILNRFESFEIEYGKDLSCFNVTEILDTYKQIECKSYDALNNIHSQVLAYATWCEKKTKKNNYAKLNSYDILSLVGDKDADRIITREELLDKIKSLPNPSDSFILLCLFEGIKGHDFSEIREIKWEDFEGNKLNIVPGRIMSFYKNGVPKPRTLTVSKELIQYADYARDEYNYTPLVLNAEENVPLAKEEYIIKRTLSAVTRDTQPRLTRRIVSIITYLYGANEKKISVSTIRDSGKIYYIKQMKKDPYDIIFGDDYQIICNRFNDNIQRQTFWNKYQSLF